MKRRLSYVIAAILMVAFLLILFFIKRSKKPDVIYATGIVEGVEANISTVVQGRIWKICCKEGDTVTEGDIIIELENDEIKAAVDQALAGIEKAKADISVSESAIESAKANLKGAEADIINAEADVDKARVQMEEAKREMNRLDTLYKENIVPKQSLDIGVTNFDTAVANYHSSTAKLKAAYSKKEASIAQLKTSERQYNSLLAGLRQAEANLSYARAKLSETMIKSPLSGTVIFKALEKGEFVNPGTTILTLVDLADLYVRVDIEESMIESIGLHSEAIIRTSKISDRTLMGKISEIGRYAEFATQKDMTRGRQDIKTFKVKVSVNNSDGILKPGMTVEVEIPLRDAK